MRPIQKDHQGFNVDISGVMNATLWIAVLAAPHLCRTIRRAIDPVHVARLLDVWIAYADRGDRYQTAMFSPVPYEQRPALARRLRDLVAAWKPPELPAEITETARALLRAEGLRAPHGDWDSFTFDEPDIPVEDMLPWPEGVPMLLRRDAKE